MVELFRRGSPYTGHSHVEVLREVVDPNKQRRPSIPNGCGPMLKSLMGKCWLADPAARPDMTQVRELLECTDVREYEAVWQR
eukprot:CAMPEP_0196753176 /NCGR_PEP_ID=MMETSP1091-20130531/89751_1 /TAXON_ID=302021 /ORGANISM="Rhodomonas sp., Strain CCMP768" /LENGTH=81 /DNA_ID=CAMNT_0042101255 /DNA_START=27 /DNA_END=269 /DNA_ORIENTATION=-